MNWKEVIKTYEGILSDMDDETISERTEPVRKINRENKLQEKDSIYIYCEEKRIRNVLDKIFHVEQEERIGRSHTFYISRGYGETHVVPRQECVQLFIPHIFQTKIFPIILSDQLDLRKLDRAYQIYVLCEKVDNFNELQLRRYKRQGICTFCADEEELKKKLFEMELLYDVQFLKDFVSEKKKIASSILGVENLSLISLEIIGMICKEEEKIPSVLKSCYECILRHYQKSAKELLMHYVKNHGSTDILLYITVYCSCNEVATKNLHEYAQNRLLPLIQRIHEEYGDYEKSRIFNIVSEDKSVLELDEYINKLIKKLAMKMGEVR